MFYQMDGFKKVTEVFFKNKDGRRSYVGLDIYSHFPAVNIIIPLYCCTDIETSL